MDHNREQAYEPGMSSAERAYELRTQFLPNGLSSDFRSEFLAIQSAAVHDSHDLLTAVVRVNLKNGRSSSYVLRTYVERFKKDSEILGGLTDHNCHLVDQLDAVIVQLNALLREPETADLQEVARLCEEANTILHTDVEDEKKAA